MPAKDMVAGRGERRSTPLGTSIFVGLRAIDPFLQYHLLSAVPLAGLLAKTGLSTRPSTNLLSSIGLDAFRSTIFAMSLGSALKHIIWIAYISNEAMYPGGAAIICAFNTVFNSINSILATTDLSSQVFPGQLYLGAALYVTGILVELVSELQRKWFKDDPKNQGKPYGGGLFGWARSINYGGYTLWRGGYALAAGGPAWGLLAGSMLAYDFATRAIPVMDDYCSKRYGAAWQEVKKKVPYRLLPFLY